MAPLKGKQNFLPGFTSSSPALPDLPCTTPELVSSPSLFCQWLRYSLMVEHIGFMAYAQYFVYTQCKIFINMEPVLCFEINMT